MAAVTGSKAVEPEAASVRATGGSELSPLAPSKPEDFSAPVSQKKKSLPDLAALLVDMRGTKESTRQHCQVPKSFLGTRRSQLSTFTARFLQ